jgi:integrase
MARKPRKHRGIFERPKGSGVSWVLYYDQYGRRHREKVGFKSAALRIYQQRKPEIQQGKFEPEDVKRKHRNATVPEIIDDYLEAYQAGGRKAIKDTKLRAGYWKELWRDRAARSILPSDIEKARAELLESQFMSNNNRNPSEGRSQVTVNRYLAALKSLAVQNEKVEYNPVKRVKLARENNKRTRYLTEEEEARLLAVLPGDHHALVQVALHTGMRKGEQLHLRWSDVDFQRKRITIRESKAGEARHIPMNGIVIQTLQAVPRMLHNPHVFYGSNSGEHLKNGIKNTDWKRYLRKAGIEDLHWHDLRHTFASRLVMRGVDLFTVSKLLGHSNLEMTQRYTHLAADYLQQAVEVLVVPGVEQPPKQPLAASETVASTVTPSFSIRARSSVG